MICGCCCIQGTFYVHMTMKRQRNCEKLIVSRVGWIKFTLCCLVKKFRNCCLLSRQEQTVSAIECPSAVITRCSSGSLFLRHSGHIFENSLTEGTLGPEMYRLSFVVLRVLQTNACPMNTITNITICSGVNCRCYYCTLNLLSSFYD